MTVTRKSPEVPPRPVQKPAEFHFCPTWLSRRGGIMGITLFCTEASLKPLWPGTCSLPHLLSLPCCFPVYIWPCLPGHTACCPTSCPWHMLTPPPTPQEYITFFSVNTQSAFSLPVLFHLVFYLRALSFKAFCFCPLLHFPSAKSPGLLAEVTSSCREFGGCCLFLPVTDLSRLTDSL